jgi:hypothetical protein
MTRNDKAGPVRESYVPARVILATFDLSREELREFSCGQHTLIGTSLRVRGRRYNWSDTLLVAVLLGRGLKT